MYLSCYYFMLIIMTKILDDGGRIRETQGKGTKSRRAEWLDIFICREADYLKKKLLFRSVNDSVLHNLSVLLGRILVSGVPLTLKT